MNCCWCASIRNRPTSMVCTIIDIIDLRTQVYNIYGTVYPSIAGESKLCPRNDHVMPMRLAQTVVIDRIQLAVYCLSNSFAGKILSCFAPSLVPRPFEGRRKGLVRTVCACSIFPVNTGNSDIISYTVRITNLCLRDSSVSCC